MLAVQRYFDKPRLNLESKRWLSRRWKARVDVYERHLLYANGCKQWLKNSEALLSVGTFVGVKLDPFDKMQYSSKLELRYKGPLVILERLNNGKTYQVKDIISGHERQVTREQMTGIYILFAWV